jgi:hypothetical protein
MLVESTSSSNNSRIRAVMAATCLATAPLAADYFERSWTDGSPFPAPIRSAYATGTADAGLIMFTGQQSAGTRETTEREHLIATLRQWESFKENWDGEGAKEPSLASLRAASRFACALESSDTIPEPQLHDTGRAGLFWDVAGLYADLEFLENGKIAYYIEREDGRHKGVVDFDGRRLPGVFRPLLNA